MERPIGANNGETQIQLAREGVGITRVGVFSAWDDIQAGTVIPLLEAFNPGDREPIQCRLCQRRQYADPRQGFRRLPRRAAKGRGCRMLSDPQIRLAVGKETFHRWFPNLPAPSKQRIGKGRFTGEAEDYDKSRPVEARHGLHLNSVTIRQRLDDREPKTRTDFVLLSPLEMPFEEMGQIVVRDAVTMIPDHDLAPVGLIARKQKGLPLS